jgi:hypothetical protein
MRRLIALALVLGLLGALTAAPAGAKKRKKKSKPPITFEASGSFAVGNPGSINGASITGNEFAETCAIPATQGLDGFVVELSEEISKVTSTASLSGGDATGFYDLDMYYFNADCAPVGAASTAESSETGVFPAGTKYVLVAAFMGAQLEFELTATEMK